jgi:hypothetical protein
MTRLTRCLATSSFAPRDCHAGIKARGAGNETREEKPRLVDSLLATAETVFGKVKMPNFHKKSNTPFSQTRILHRRDRRSQIVKQIIHI